MYPLAVSSLDGIDASGRYIKDALETQTAPYLWLALVPMANFFYPYDKLLGDNEDGSVDAVAAEPTVSVIF